jgi:serine/threonine-protein kinase RsbW
VKNDEQQGLDPSQALQKGSILERLIESLNGLNWLKDKRHRQQLYDTRLQKIFLQANTDLHAVDQVLNWYEQLENLPIPRTAWWQCRLALVEGFTNAVRHAHKGLPLETPIELEVTVFNERLEIRIWDYGQPFDLEAKLSELCERDQDPLECEAESGLKTMLQLADRVSYT